MEVIQNIKETPLCQIAFKYGTDKCPRIRHNYTPFYFNMFKNRTEKIKKVLEIGVGYKKLSVNRWKQYPYWQYAASLKMWRDFFPNAWIYGTDILEEAMHNDDRIRTFLCDQANEKQLKKLLRKIGTDIDLVIDDGSHQHQHQVFTARVLRPLIPKKADYIIEDVLYTNTVIRRLGNFDCKVHSFPVANKMYSNNPETVHNDRLVIVKMK